jgi:type III secretion protein R
VSSLPDPIVLLALIVTLGIVPFVALLVTSFTKLVIVFSLLRLALGVQQVPPNMVLNGLAIILTVYIMAPVGMQAAATLKQSSAPPGTAMRADDMLRVANAVKPPLKAFLEKHANERERKFFVKSAAEIWPKEQAAELKSDDVLVLVPAFTVSELTQAFQIGFMLYLAFVVIDLVIANILLALGMSMISPTIISVPFKLLLFVVLDGWSQLIHSLILTYR